MNRIKGLIAISAFGLLILGFPAIASAQWNGGYGGNGGYGRNGGYNNGRYGDLRGVVQSLKNQARSFENAADRASDRNDDRRGGWGNVWGGNNNGGRVDRIEDLADEFAKATNRLADRYGNGRNLNNSEDEARRVLDIASRIDRMIGNSRGGRGGYGGGYGGGYNNLQSQWSNMQGNLNAIADVYGYNNRGGRRNNGGWRNNFPF